MWTRQATYASTPARRVKQKDRETKKIVFFTTKTLTVHSDCKHLDYQPYVKQSSCDSCKCPSPCCEGDWPREEWNWAVVNTYKYLFIAERRLLCAYDDMLKKLYYGYNCDAAVEDTIDRVLSTVHTLKRETKRFKHQVKCLCSQELKTIFERVERFEKCETAATNVLIQTDENWVKQNLLCASREDWEQYALALCSLLRLEIRVDRLESLDTTCNIAFEITKSQKFCDILVAAAIIQHVCEIGYSLQVTKEQCKLEWKLLIEKNPECEIDLQTYISCREAGLTYDVVQLILDAGLNIQTKDGELFLLGLLQEYKLNSLFFTEMPPKTEETAEFYKSPKSFTEKYLRDYNINDSIIEKILSKKL